MTISARQPALFKVIVCSVAEGMRASFSLAQTKWNGLAEIRGFRGQLGGWDLRSRKDACIVGVWQNHDSYKRFMDGQHDLIYESSEQAATYEHIDVALLQPIYHMPGVYKNISQCLAIAKEIRIADCIVKPGREGHFTDVQKRIWIPGMRQAPGMLAGTFANLITQENRFIVVTLWASREAHENYVQFVLPSLQKAANVDEDVAQLTGRFVKVVQDWVVLPNI